MVYPTGKRQFILRYRSRDHKQREFRVGQFGVISVDEARSKAKTLIGAIQNGADPQWDRKIGLASGKTFNDIIDHYLAWAEKNHKPTSLEEVRRYCRLHLRKLFGEIQCNSLTRGVVQQIYDGLDHSPSFSAKIIDWSRVMWSWADRREMVDDRRNPFQIDRRITKSRRKRILSPEEYRRLWAVIEQYRYIGTIPNVTIWAVEMLMLTPLRKTEVFRMQWKNVSKDAGIILVEEHKTDQRDDDLIVIITPAISDLPCRIPRTPTWLFPCPDSASGHIESIDKAWTRIRKEAGLYDAKNRVTLHDLRRSWDSVGAKLGFDPTTMGKVIGNSPRVNAEHYWHLDMEKKRHVSEAVSNLISSYKER
jgi:integrase